VSRTCVDVSPTHGVTYQCQMFANYGANDGDSGSPIVLDIQAGPTPRLLLVGFIPASQGATPSSVRGRDCAGLWKSGGCSGTSRHGPAAAPPTPNLPSDSTFTVEGSGYTARSFCSTGMSWHSYSTTRQRDDHSEFAAAIRSDRIGGVPGPAGPPQYIVQIPDPGQTFAAVDSIVRQLDSEPGVARALMVRFRTPVRLKDAIQPMDLVPACDWGRRPMPRGL